jgi:hypothetical protein
MIRIASHDDGWWMDRWWMRIGDDGWWMVMDG